MVALRKVRPADAAGKQHVAHKSAAYIRRIKHHLAGRVAGAVIDIQHQLAHRHLVAIVQPSVGRERLGAGHCASLQQDRA